jgi:acyl-CoA thioesterase
MSSADEVARRCAETLRERDRVAADLGMEVTGVGPGQARVRMTVTPAMVNGHGLAHGGYLFLLADSAFAYACNTHDRVTVAAAADIVFATRARCWRPPRPNASASAAAASTT